MSSPFHIVATATLGTVLESPADLLYRAGFALLSNLDGARLDADLKPALLSIFRADRCQLSDAQNPSEPLSAIAKETVARRQALRTEGEVSSLSAPLLVRQRPLGAIVLERAAADPFTQEQLNLLAAIAPLASLALRNARLYDRATLDGLTGLPNRQRFVSELEDAVGEPLSLVLADLDHFHDKNGVYGRPVGDRVLAELGELLLHQPVALVARSGDDEFAAVVAGAAARAREVAEDLRKLVEARVFDEKHEGIHCTLSLGVAELRRGEMASLLFTRASDALAAAKRGGRNRVELAR